MYCHTMSSFELYRTNGGEGSDEARTSQNPRHSTLVPQESTVISGRVETTPEEPGQPKAVCLWWCRQSARSLWRLPGQREEKEKD